MEPLPCSGCQQLLTPGARFCRNCGRSVADGVAPAAPVTKSVAKAVFEARWRNIRIVAWLFGLLLATSFVFALVSRHNSSPWIELLAGSTDAVLIVGFAIAMRAEVAPLFALPRCNRKTTLTLILLTVGFVAVMSGYFDVLKHVGIPTLRATSEFQNAGWPVSAMFLMVSVMPGIFEEIGFRGVIQSLLERTVEPREAWLIQGALFSVLHLSPLIFPSHFVMGLVFGYLRLRTRSLYPGMLLHAGWNALVVFSEI
ncbi:MAG: CPBP family intramembrane glutamic endopeptidase [Steroidobacteraceae bacterium]